MSVYQPSSSNLCGCPIATLSRSTRTAKTTATQCDGGSARTTLRTPSRVISRGSVARQGRAHAAPKTARSPTV
jgi:hypothetical protein